MMEWVKRNTLRCFRHIERMKSEESMKKVNLSEIVGPNSRERPLGRLKNRVKEYMCVCVFVCVCVCMCVREIVGPDSRERPLGRWKDRV